MFKLNRKGQTLVEYVLIIALIAVLTVGLVRIFGGYLTDAITKAGCTINGKEFVEGAKIGKGYCAGDENKLFD